MKFRFVTVISLSIPRFKQKKNPRVTSFDLDFNFGERQKLCTNTRYHEAANKKHCKHPVESQNHQRSSHTAATICKTRRIRALKSLLVTEPKPPHEPSAMAVVEGGVDAAEDGDEEQEHPRDRQHRLLTARHWGNEGGVSSLFAPFLVGRFLLEFDLVEDLL